MTSGSLTDLDPPPARERRWPFYVAWIMGGIVVGAVLVSHVPAGLLPARVPVAAPAAAEAPVPSAAPAAPRLAQPPQGPFRVTIPAGPVPIAPARP